jgi:hypothetical protein
MDKCIIELKKHLSEAGRLKMKQPRNSFHTNYKELHELQRAFGT